MRRHGPSLQQRTDLKRNIHMCCGQERRVDLPIKHLHPAKIQPRAGKKSEFQILELQAMAGPLFDLLDQDIRDGLRVEKP